MLHEDLFEIALNNYGCTLDFRGLKLTGCCCFPFGNLIFFFSYFIFFLKAGFIALKVLEWPQNKTIKHLDHYHIDLLAQY